MDKYQQTIETFNNVAEQYWQKFNNFELYEPTYDWFCDHLNPGSHQKQIDVLEIACGPGNVSHYLLKKNPAINLFGIDLAPNMIELAKQHNPTASYAIMDCRNINNLQHNFAAVMCGFCLPYLDWTDSLKLINDMAQLLTPGGLLYLSITKGKTQDDGFKASKSSNGAVFVHHHATDDIKAALVTANLELIGCRLISHIHNDQTTNDAFILARKPT